jgi:uncharacterized metal-binding protein
MASGKVHDLRFAAALRYRAITVTTPIMLAAAIASGHADVGIIAAAAYYLGGMYLSPDLDLVSRPFKRWGCLRWFWLPYQRLIPRHRHWLSHGPVIGSIVRLVYLAALVSPLWLLFPGLQQTQWSGVTDSNVLAFLIGVELSALNHLLLDGLLIPFPKWLKRRLKGD